MLNSCKKLEFHSGGELKELLGPIFRFLEKKTLKLHSRVELKEFLGRFVPFRTLNPEKSNPEWNLKEFLGSSFSVSDLKSRKKLKFHSGMELNRELVRVQFRFRNKYSEEKSLSSTLE